MVGSSEVEEGGSKGAILGSVGGRVNRSFGAESLKVGSHLSDLDMPIIPFQMPQVLQFEHNFFGKIAKE